MTRQIKKKAQMILTFHHNLYQIVLFVYRSMLQIYHSFLYSLYLGYQLKYFSQIAVISKLFEQNFSTMKNINFISLLPKHKRVLDSKTHRLPHNVYPKQAAEQVTITHVQPKKLADRIALMTIKMFRTVYDLTTRYDLSRMTQTRWLNRLIFLQTIAGVPGMVGGMCRHLRSIRRFQRDKGFIHHLLEQADNERFHLFTFLHMRQASKLMRLFVLLGQGVFMNGFFLGYLLNPRFCHRFVGYLEEEAVKTYTTLLKEIDREGSPIEGWNEIRAPQTAIDYYHLDQNAKMRDVILSIRADESTHRETNHFLSEVEETYEMEQEPIAKDETIKKQE